MLPLSSLALKQLPQSIGSQEQVVAMFLSRNAIRILPEGVMKLNRLTHLFLDCNSLSSLPDDFESLASLKLLDVSRNKLKALPAELGNHLKASRCSNATTITWKSAVVGEDHARARSSIGHP